MKLFYLLLISFVLRLLSLGYPSVYVFDEVYHVPAIRAISQNSSDAYNPFAKAPEPNTAYDWLHPPLAKLFQAGSVKVFGDNSFGWRFPSAIFGTLSIAGVYYLAWVLFKSQCLSLTAALIFSLDNLQFTMSRIAMNDIFVTTWILFALAFFFKKNYFLSAIFTGLALATKHSAVFLYPIFFLFGWRYFYYYLFIPPLIYLFSYLQMFLLGGSFQGFINLHQQIYWYQTSLKATHDYQSTAWQWPLLIRPVWFYVQYYKDSVANIYNLGNPAVFWGGLVALVFNRQLFLLASYLLLFSPLIFSPRILFLHHYLPALAVLAVILSRQIYQSKYLPYFLILVCFCFIWFFPLNTALAIKTAWLKYWFWLPSWK